MKNIAESQSYVKGERCGAHTQLGFINGIERVADSRVERYPIIFAEAVAKLCTQQSAEVYSAVRRVRAAGLRSPIQLVIICLDGILEKQIRCHTSVQLHSEGLVHEQISGLHGNAEVSHAVVHSIRCRIGQLASEVIDTEHFVRRSGAESLLLWKP